MDLLERHGLRILQGCWFALALVAAAGGVGSLDDRSTPVRAVLLALGGLSWAGALGALLVPRSLSLTIARTLVPAGALGAVVAAATADSLDALAVAQVLLAAACVALVVAAPVTDAFVDGSSYGPERRFALRVPPVVAATAVLAWAVVVGGATVGPLLLAARATLLGVAATAAGAILVVSGVRALHGLSQRWIVLVPAGLVVHDPMTMPEAQLFLRQTIGRLGPALVEGSMADADASGTTADTEDLTAGASGLALALEVTEPVDLLVRARGEGQVRSVDRVLFTPLRSAALLEAARRHRLPVG